MTAFGFFIYHALLVYQKIFTFAFIIIELALFIFKGFSFPISRHSISVEISALFFYFIIKLSRIYLAEIGNRSESVNYIIYSTILITGDIYTHIYFLCLSVYVLEIEVIINAFGLFMVLFELLSSIYTMIKLIGSKSEI